MDVESNQYGSSRNAENPVNDLVRNNLETLHFPASSRKNFGQFLDETDEPHIDDTFG